MNLSSGGFLYLLLTGCCYRSFLCIQSIFKKMKGVGVIQWERYLYQESTADGLQVMAVVCWTYDAAVRQAVEEIVPP